MAMNYRFFFAIESQKYRTFQISGLFQAAELVEWTDSPQKLIQLGFRPEKTAHL